MYVWFKQSERFSVLSVASPVLVGLTWSILTPKKYRKAIADWILVGFDLFIFLWGIMLQTPCCSRHTTGHSHCAAAHRTVQGPFRAHRPAAPVRSPSFPSTFAPLSAAWCRTLRNTTRVNPEQGAFNTPGSRDEQACWKGDHLGPKETDPILYYIRIA